MALVLSNEITKTITTNTNETITIYSSGECQVGIKTYEDVLGYLIDVDVSHLNITDDYSGEVIEDGYELYSYLYDNGFNGIPCDIELPDHMCELYDFVLND
jgi:hypothetical protein